MPTPDQLDNAARRRVAILDTIRESITTRGYPPSVADLVDAHGVSRRMVQIDLDRLAAHGLIEVDPGVTRGIRLTGHRVALIPHGDTEQVAR